MIENEHITTNLGVQQGSSLSPKLFVLQINQLLVQLSAINVKVLAFADDIVLSCDGEMKLFPAIRILKDWCKKMDIEINYEKSAIMKIRVDKRQNNNEYITIQYNQLYGTIEIYTK